MNRSQVPGTVVLDIGRGQQVVGKRNVGTEPEQMCGEVPFPQIRIVESVARIEGEILVQAKHPAQIQRSFGAVVKSPGSDPGVGAEFSPIEGADSNPSLVPLVQVWR